MQERGIDQNHADTDHDEKRNWNWPFNSNANNNDYDQKTNQPDQRQHHGASLDLRENYTPVQRRRH